MPHLQPIVKALDTSIRAAVPGLHYAVNYKRAFYGLPQSELLDWTKQAGRTPGWK